jgi:hypothetical protein
MLTPATPEQKKPHPGKTLSDAELNDARDLLKVFLQAWKNYGLYPEGHATSRKSLETLISAFTGFFLKHGDLGLVVENERLLWRDSVIHEVSSGAAADDLIFPLYRDGINWIEFEQGLPIEELALFFSILNKYKSLQEETEGDVVTELVDGDLAYIKFKAVDTLWQDHPLLDFSSILTPAAETGADTSQHELQEAEQPKSEVASAKTPAAETAADSSQNEPQEAEQPESEKRTDAFAKSIADPSFSEALWKISSAEHEELQKMVQAEENWDNTEDVFDVLVAILRSQTDKSNFSAVLGFTMEEVIDTIEQKEFGLLLNLFQSLYQLLYSDTADEYEWIRPLIESFFQNLSKPELFDLIGAKLLTLNDNDTEKIRSLQQVLLYFSPDVILFLGPIILQTRAPEVRKMILAVAEHLCLRDIAPLEKILEHPDKTLGEALLPILRRLMGERANTILWKMIGHPSEKIRAQGVKQLVSKNPQTVSKLFYLIDDPYGPVRKEILAAIAGQKSSTVENLLLKYLKDSPEHKEPEHILACYEALGRCGSVTATQFLKRILLSNGWNRFTGFGIPLHRQGAAAALARMDTPETMDILLEASQSKFQVIRQAVEMTALSDALPGRSDG